jgi:5-methylcytosine-specific restriction protein A
MSPTIRLNFKDKVKRNSTKINNEIHSIVYNTSKWRELRIYFLSKNPLCKRCLDKGILTLGIDVHHIIEITNGKTKEDKQRLGFDYTNLKTLCKECHIEEHHNKKNINI